MSQIATTPRLCEWLPPVGGVFVCKHCNQAPMVEKHWPTAERGDLLRVCRDAPTSIYRSTARIPRPVIKGPGDFLHDAIAAMFGEEPTRECGCTDRINLMNAWGPSGCRARLEEIVDWLVAEIESHEWTFIDETGEKRPRREPWLATLAKMVMALPLGEMCVRQRCRRMVLAAIEQAERHLAEKKAEGEPITIVCPYLARGALGNELLYMVRSVEANYVGPVDIWIIGDRPYWWRRNDRFIHCPSVSRNARADVAHKMWVVSRTEEIPDEFFWWMDDVHIVTPIGREFLEMAWVRGGPMTAARLKKWQPKSSYQKRKKATYEALHTARATMEDYAAHTPLLVEKAKLAALFKKYDVRGRKLVNDLLYCNEYAAPKQRPPVHIGRLMARINSDDLSDAELQRRLRTAVLHNYVAHAYAGAVERNLARMFSQPSRWEVPGSVIQPKEEITMATVDASPAASPSTLGTTQDATTMKLWSFWEGDKPHYVRLCHDTLLKHNPNAEILNMERFRELQAVDSDLDFSHLPMAQQADWIRIYLLRHFGGIWIDADCIVMRPLDRFLDALRCCWSLTYYEQSGHIGGGFVGSPPNSPHIVAIYDRAKAMVASGNALEWRALMGANMEQVLMEHGWQGFLKLDWRQFIPVKPHLNKGPLTVRGTDEEHESTFSPLAYTYMLTHNKFPRRLSKLKRHRLLTGSYFLSYLFRRALA